MSKATNRRVVADNGVVTSSGTAITSNANQTYSSARDDMINRVAAVKGIGNVPFAASSLDQKPRGRALSAQNVAGAEHQPVSPYIPVVADLAQSIGSIQSHANVQGRLPDYLPPYGFWSYANSDEIASNGKPSKLRQLFADDLQLKTGRHPKVRIFQDVKTIPQGSSWQREINKALDASSFLIAVVTPAFLQSEMCCLEVLRFHEREKALGRDDLIFPFHYISTEDIDPDRPGEVYDRRVLDILRERQEIDFRLLRVRPIAHEDVSALMDRFSNAVRAALRRMPSERC